MIDRTRKACRRGALTGLAAVGLLAASAFALGEQAVSVSVDDRTVSVAATDAPQSAILEALAAHGLIVVVSAAALDQRVDVAAGPVALGDLVRRLLRHHSYLYVEQPGVDQVWVFAKRDSRQRPGWRTSHGDDTRQVALELTDPDPEVRIEAVLAAAESEPAAAIPLLLPAILDPAPAVRDAAQAVLEDLGATDYLPADRLTK